MIFKSIIKLIDAKTGKNRNSFSHDTILEVKKKNIKQENMSITFVKENRIQYSLKFDRISISSEN